METKKFWSPYLAGLGVGFALLLSILITGWGVGASTAFAVIPALLINSISSDLAMKIDYFARYLDKEIPVLNWHLFQSMGLLAGAFFSAKLFKNFKVKLDKPESMSSRNRVLITLGGGFIMGFSARLAGGCASGLALSGSAEMAIGGWMFMIGMFASGFLLASIFRRLWS
jgi:hypothetical protein